MRAAARACPQTGHPIETARHMPVHQQIKRISLYTEHNSHTQKNR